MSSSIDFDLPSEPRKPARDDVDQYEAERRREEQSRQSTPPARVNGQAPGRCLPHSLEAEEYLLSSILLDGADVLSQCVDAHIAPDWFYDPKHGICFTRLLDMRSKRIPIAVETLAEELKTSRELEQVGGYPFLTQISSRIPTTAQASYFVEKVREQALLRQYIRAHTAAVEDAYAATDIKEYVAALKPRFDAIANGVNGVSQGVRLIDCQYPQKNDPQILLGEDDCLSRGGGWLIISYAGVGKSSWAMQMALTFGLGRAMFGLKSHTPRTTLIIQGEDSPRYIGKVAASFAAAEKLGADELATLQDRVWVHELRGVDGEAFHQQVERLVEKHNPDLVIINPAYIYVSGDINGLKDVKPWLSRLDAINQKREDRKKVGWIIVHHTGKPTPKNDKGQRAELDNWETVYMGTGSSAWANWPRMTSMLEPRASNSDGQHFWLKFGKGWKNTGIVREFHEGGEKRIRPANKIAIKYTEKTMLVAGEQRPMVYWEFDEEGQKEADEKASVSRENGKKGGRAAKFEWPFFREPFRNAAPAEDKAAGFNHLYRVANDLAGISKSSFNIIIQKGVESGELRRIEKGPQAGRYWVSDGPAVQPGDAADAESAPAQGWWQKDD